MMNVSPESLLLVFDSSKARFYRMLPSGKIKFLNEVQSDLSHSNKDIVSDRPGRSFSSTTAGRSAIEPQHDPHKQEKHNFVHQLVETLESAYDRNEFRQLVVAAPERSIGEFRSLIPDKIKKSIQREVPKELVHYSDHEIEARLKST